VESTNGSIVYVDQGDEETGADFVPPVRYYAAYGIPESALENQEVVTNETG
jgi:hypothetical protein